MLAPAASVFPPHKQVVPLMGHIKSCWSLILHGFQMPQQFFQLFWEGFRSAHPISFPGSLWSQQLATFPSLLFLIFLFLPEPCSFLSPCGQEKWEIGGGNSPRTRELQQQTIQFILRLLMFGTKVWGADPTKSMTDADKIKTSWREVHVIGGTGRAEKVQMD